MMQHCDNYVTLLATTLSASFYKVATSLEGGSSFLYRPKPQER